MPQLKPDNLLSARLNVDLLDTALLIIDMQRGINDPRFGSRNNPLAESNMIRLLAAWRKAERPIVHVRHISRSPSSVFFPGQPGAEFQAEFLPLPHEHVVEKNVPDAFTHGGLERWLHMRAIRQLVIVGVITNNSVEATARSAGNLGFSVLVPADAAYTFDKCDFNGTCRTAEEVHAMSLANLHGEYATVTTTEQLLAASQDN